MNDEDVKRVSKRLSYWLRHAPDAAGLTLDGSGWTGVDEVLAALRTRGEAAGAAHLEEVVARNDKQRFELSPDGRRIRARQGHSVAVQGDWPQTEPPGLLYHGTVERYLNAIMAEGLKAMARHHVHLSPDRQTANTVGARRGRPVVLEVEAGRLSETGQPFFLTGNGVWLTSHVPAAFLRRVN